MDIEETIKYMVLAIMMTLAPHNCSSSSLDGGDTLLLWSSLTGNQTMMSKNGNTKKTIVWVANRENPVTSLPGALEFSSDGHLRLLDRNGQSVWSTGIGQRGSRAVIMDSGNFIVLDANNESAIVWESFAHPTDTWLPGMKMWKGMKLASWKSSTDPSIGLFSYGMDMTPGKTQMMMVYNNTVPYLSSGEWVGDYFAKEPEMEGSKKLQAICVTLSPSRIYIIFAVNQIEDILTGRFRLAENGGFEFYYLMDDGKWSLGWSTYRGQCSDYEICGAYGLCNANDVCSCVQGFTPKNGSQDWWSSGCARQRPLQCSVTEDTTDGFLEAENQYLSEKEAILYYNKQTQQGCRTSCVNNCSCTAFAFAISDPPVCRLWFGDLLGMRVSSEGQSVFIRLAASELRRSTSERRIKASALAISLSTIASFFAVAGLLLASFILWKRRRLLKKNVEEEV